MQYAASFDCFDMGATANNFYCYLYVWIDLTLHTTLISLIALVGSNANNIYYYLNKAVATILGLNCFDMQYTASLD